MINQSISLNPKLNQHLKLSPLVMQQLKLLQLSQVELLEHIADELEQNPLLQSEGEPVMSAEDFSSYFKSLNEMKMSFEKDDEITEPSISYTPTLSEHLLSQLPFLDISERELKSCKIIIGNLDEKGYLCTDLDELSEHFHIPVELLISSLKAVQSLDPKGVGARNLEECLWLQAESHGDSAVLRRIIYDHLADVAENRMKLVSKSLGVSLQKLDSLIQFLRSLDPKPGLQYEHASHISTEFIVPDVYIEFEDDLPKAKIPESLSPKLSINSYYKKLLESDSDPKSKVYLTEKLNRAVFLLKSIEQRKSTLIAVTESIALFQSDFLQGRSELLPLNMKDVSEKLGIHESTVSRAVKGKYVHSPAGVFPLKFFFSSKRSPSGDSSSSLKSRLAELVSSEDPKKPYSDQKLAEILNSEGFKTARRTVSKYREELNIKTSSLRKIHK
ncbi:RNA polymerase sigma-54 factor [Andreesenia angusta]|uniref:RNA polymerase sigma-54 factor n=1 Tax=Andreesenia angusta TaxID=39480 RepID=A0A1S1V4N0_9FIRM|nr:RNA polymerase factor sigma-54 [Andreesenia angusta]OHW61593.1 RNA polymerase sigma-54 factor [Andreesenia angusta]